jgi:hypothetical protein
MEKPKCKKCEHCKDKGRAERQCGAMGRKYYYCTHDKVKSLRDRHGLPISGFIAFGTHSLNSPLVLATSPRWCPLNLGNVQRRIERTLL